MHTLLRNYNAMPRHTNLLQIQRSQAVARLERMLSREGETERALQILADLVNFKHFRNAHIPCLCDRSLEQARALAALREHCNCHLLYTGMLALARNRGTGGLLRDLPETLRQLLDERLNFDERADLWCRLSQGARQFLANAGVTPPAFDPRRGNPYLAAGLRQVSMHGYAGGYGTVLLYWQPGPRQTAVLGNSHHSRLHRELQRTLNFLLITEPHCVVDASLSRPLLQGMDSHALQQTISRTFDNYNADQQLSPMQRKWLARIGPAVVYAGLKEGVAVYPRWRNAVAPAPDAQAEPDDLAASALAEQVVVNHNAVAHIRQLVWSERPQTTVVLGDEDADFTGLADQPGFCPEVYARDSS